MKRIRGLVLLLVLAGMLPAAQFVFIDDIITWTKNAYDYPEQLGTTNWASPVNYKDGTVHVRYEPIDKPSSYETGVQLCFWQDNYTLETCAPCKTYNNEGVYYYNWGRPSSWWKINGTPMDWTRAFGAMYLMHKATCSGNLLMSGACGTHCFTGSVTELEKHVPITFKVLGVAVSPGATFVEPEGWRSPMNVAAPTFNPPPGNYPSKIYIRMASATPDAKIFFSYYDTPTVQSRQFGDSLAVPTNRVIKAVAYKHCSYSTVAEVTYTIGTGVADNLPVYMDALGINPHPVRTTGRIGLPEAVSGKTVFTLYGHDGRAVRHYKNTLTFDTAGMSAGIYAYTFKTPNGLYAGKLIKQ